MSGGPIPVLWVCGPPGVGKSTVAWDVFSQLAEEGTRTGHVDIDQLGMCYPEAPSDPGRHAMKARNLGAVIDTFRGAGARCVVVSGVVDLLRGPRGHLDELPAAALTVCRLRCDLDELRERFVRRGTMLDQWDEVVRDAEAQDRSRFADVCVDTSGASPHEVTRLVREASAGWPALSPPPDRPAADPGSTVMSASGPILWLCGATASGKSTVGWEMYSQALRAGSIAAFVDLEQLGFLRPAPPGDPHNHRVKAANLASVWQTYRARGVRCMVVVGPVESREAVRGYAEALPAATITLCRLHAGPEDLARRVLLRGGGEGPHLAGDRLRGQPEATLLGIAEEAVAEAAVLERAGIGDVRIDTEGRTVEEVAAAVTEEWSRRADSNR